jgi:hypothetical protein
MTATPIHCALGIALPGGAWHVAHVTLWLPNDGAPVTPATLEREAIAAYSAAYLRTDAVHVWLMEDDGWEEDDEQTAMRQRRRRDTLDAPDDLPF